MSIWTLGGIELKRKIGTYRGGRKLRDEAPKGPAESNLPESGHRTQGIGEGIKQLVKTEEKNLKAERESGSCVIWWFFWKWEKVVFNFKGFHSFNNNSESIYIVNIISFFFLSC